MRETTTFGFKKTSSLLNDRIRRAGEGRGFAVSRVLTHWAEIAGRDLAAMARPVRISYGKGGFGASLTVLTTGAQAPLLEMQKETLRERVNAAYGYNAISRIHITQTAPDGFAEGQVAFSPAPPSARHTQEPDTTAPVEGTEQIADSGLRQALERLGRNVLSKPKR